MTILTPQQKKVAQLLLQGKSNFEIGLALNLFEGGVKFHLTNMFKTYRVKSRHALMLKLAQEARLDPSILGDEIVKV